MIPPIKNSKAAAKLTSWNKTEPTAEQQSAIHRRVRLQHASETAEDYVRAIAQLCALQGEARVVDLARRFGISHVTVIRALARLQRGGFITTRPYRSVFLTEDGERLAKKSSHRYEIVVTFLRRTGVPQKIAQADAEGLEHHVSAKTLSAWKRFLLPADKAQRF
jgi:DtxR family manganese transport transcriptional regulator